MGTKTRAAGFAFLFLTFSAILIFGCSINQPRYTLSGNTLKVHLNGYIPACSKPSVVYAKESNVLRQANQNLPGKGQYYLDGEYHGYGTCDFSACTKVDFYETNLVEYKKVGEKESPESKEFKVPQYETVNLSGQLKVELKYFTDNECSNEKSISLEINR